MLALADDSRRLGRRVAAHCHGSDGIVNAIGAEVTTIEHCSFWNDTGIEYNQETADQIAEKGIYVCPTLGTGERARQRAEAGGVQIPRRFEGMREARFDNLRRLIDSGVQIISGNDAGVTWTGFDDFQLDLEMLVEYVGVPATEAIVSATSKAAEAIGSDDFGTLEAGKRADVLVVSGDATYDIGALREVQVVKKSGETVVDNR